MLPNEPTLATATKEDIQRALSDTGPTEAQRCGYCGGVFTRKNKWQVFCCKKCRESHHNDNGRREIEKLQGRIAYLERQVSELQAELAKSISTKLEGEF